MNAIMVIHPYKSDGMWVFDDRNAGLVQEPFVSGADKIIDRMVTQIPDAESGFTLIFAGTPFPSYQLKLDWRREEYGGNWYYSPNLASEGWLCPALFKYFDMTPKEIYAQFKAKE
jgi:hypothetical protein